MAVSKQRILFLFIIFYISDQTGSMAEGKDNGVFSNHAVCLVLDYGSQYTQLIARRIRDNGVLSMLLPGDVSLVRCA